MLRFNLLHYVYHFTIGHYLCCYTLKMISNSSAIYKMLFMCGCINQYMKVKIKSITVIHSVINRCKKRNIFKSISSVTFDQIFDVFLMLKWNDFLDFPSTQLVFSFELSCVNNRLVEIESSVHLLMQQV